MPSHPAVWLDATTLLNAVTDVHIWLLVGWLGFSLLVAWVVGGDAK